jgi:hypothetical protein
MLAVGIGLILAVLGEPAAPPSAPKPDSTPSAPFAVLDRIAAVVGDDIILESEVDRIVTVGLVPYRPGETARVHRDRILDELITDLLRERQLRRTAGLPPDPAEVEARLRSLEERVRKENGESFDAVLETAHVSRDEVRGWLRRGLALETYVRERISPTIKPATDAELRAYYEGPFRDQMTKKGVAALPPFAEVQESLRDLVREERLNAEIAKWTSELRQSTRVIVYRRG